MEATQKPKSSGYRFSVAHALVRSRMVLFCSRSAARLRSRSISARFSGLLSMSNCAEARSAAMTAGKDQYQPRLGGGEQFDAPMKVADDVTRNARKGRVSALKDAYLLLAPTTATVPTAAPMAPPSTPPWSEALWVCQQKFRAAFCTSSSLIMRLLLLGCEDLHIA